MGFGRGVYPVDQAPVLPIHPNGRSKIVPYFAPKGAKATSRASTALIDQADKLGVKIYNGIKIEPIKKLT
jgi:hypothetical protein